MGKADFSDLSFHLFVQGIHPLKSKKSYKFGVLVSVVTIGALGCIMFGEIIRNYSGRTVQKRLDIVIFLFQVIGKAIMLGNNKEKLSALIGRTRRFWPLSPFEDEHREALAPHRFEIVAIRIFRLVLYVDGICYFTIPCIMGHSLVPLYGETDEDSQIPFWFIQVFFIHCYALTLINVCIGFDHIFFSFLAHVTAELRMIRRAFDKMSRSSEGASLKTIVDHHVEVLRFIKDMADVYKMVLLIQYLTSMFGIAGSFIYMLKDGMPPDLHHIVHCLIYSSVCVSQIAIYCYLGDFLAKECLVTQNLFYDIWGNENGLQRKKLDLLIIISRGQKDDSFTIGGFTKLNLTSFTQLLKTCMSMVAFINTLYNKSLE